MDIGHKQTLHVFSLSGDLGSGKHSKHSSLDHTVTTLGPDGKCCCVDLSKLLQEFLALYQTKPS